MFSLFAEILLLFFIYLISKRIFHKIRNHPPSPFLSLPILGHLYLPKYPLQHSLAQIADRYGPILYLQCGSRPVLLISSPSAAEECFTKNDIAFSNRPRLLAGKYIGYNYTSLQWAPYGDHWRNLRRVSAIELLSNYRLQSLSTIRADAVEYLIRQLYNESAEREDCVIDMKTAFHRMTLNNMMRMIAGVAEETEDVRRFMVREEKSLRQRVSLDIGEFIPFLRLLGRGSKMEDAVKRVYEVNDKFMQGLIDERRRIKGEDQDSGKKAKVMIDTMLLLQKDDPEYYTDRMIKSLMLALLTAGTNTTALTMEWALSLLLNNPRILEKARAEINEQIGNERMIQESDLNNLPYLHCIINETLRMHPIAPLIIRESSAKCTVGWYRVPRGTTVVCNAWAIQNDPKIWEHDPAEFKPERFESVREAKSGFKMLPFGSGRRACAGETLAIRLLGLALGSLIQCFEWERVGEELVDMKELGGPLAAKAQPLEGKCRPCSNMNKVLSQL